MRILHLNDEPYDSGIVHYALTVAAALRRQGHDVHFGGLPGKFPLEQAGLLGLKILPLPGWSGLLSLRRYLLEHSVELVNSHTGSSHSLAAAAAQTLPRPVGVVRTRADSRPLRRRMGSGVLWNRTDGFIAATKTILQQFRQAFADSNFPSRAVYPGFDGGPPAAWPAQERPIGIGIVGRLDPVKGHADFLRAAALAAEKNPGLRFRVAGREEHVRLEQLKALLAPGLRDRVEFLGHVPDASALMRDCHVGVVASIGSEGVSRAAVEWMAAGRPVVATAVGCLPEFVAHGETGLVVPPRDPAAMSSALLALASDRRLRETMGRRARERFERLFTLPRFARETEGFYEETLRHLPSR